MKKKKTEVGIRLSSQDRTRKLCTFELGNYLYGFDILDVKEVYPEIILTPIFHAPPTVKGYVNIRGQIHIILDLRIILGLESGDIGRESRLILFKPRVGDFFGALVDRISAITTVREDAIEERRKSSRGNVEKEERRWSYRNITSGVCKLDDQLLIVLNAGNLLSSNTRRTIFLDP